MPPSIAAIVERAFVARSSRKQRSARGKCAEAALAPTTEANLGDGLFALRPYLSSGGPFAIGSDGNVWIDAAEELRWLEYG